MSIEVVPLVSSSSPSVQLAPILEPANEKTKKLCLYWLPRTSKRLECSINVLSFRSHSALWNLTLNVILSDGFSVAGTLRYVKKREIGTEGESNKSAIDEATSNGSPPRFLGSRCSAYMEARSFGNAADLDSDERGPSLEEASSVPASIQRQTPLYASLLSFPFPPQFPPSRHRIRTYV